MGINHRKLDNQGRPLKNPYETTAEAEDRLAKNMAAGTCVQPPAAAEQCGSAPVQAQKKSHTCPQCRGFGHIVDDIVNGTTKPCPTCTAEWEYVATPHDDCVDACSINAQPAPTGIADKVREAKGLSNAVVVHTPSGELNDYELRKLVEQAKAEIMRTSGLDQKALGQPGQAMTATEVMAKKREMEKNQIRGYKGTAIAVDEDFEEGI